MPLESLPYSRHVHTLGIPSSSKSPKHAPIKNNDYNSRPKGTKYHRNLSCILILTQMFPLRLELVVVSVIRRNIGLKTLPGSDVDSEHCENGRGQSKLTNFRHGKSRLPLVLLPTSVGVLFISSQWSNTCIKQRQNVKNSKIGQEIKTRRYTHGLRERLTTSSSSEISVETEGLGNRQVSLEGVHGGTRPLLGGEDVTSSDVQTRLLVDVSIH